MLKPPGKLQGKRSSSAKKNSTGAVKLNNMAGVTPPVRVFDNMGSPNQKQKFRNAEIVNNLFDDGGSYGSNPMAHRGNNLRARN